ncbi:aminotransferase class IV [Hymenobacter aerilatus]|uniref:branched-chain-amino-acid transaminase n=1 Tax=Hymenobacter aerilatus TaxID=2932251 RepID=A0A8T9T400_9BACT|nr:aminotransferase class IV [Hymenobacter aerilatus]UOR06826.1 aminotransferase class IV [Hymenobacter aerilatus]
MLLHNDHLLPAADFALALPNRGLQFNDGFFETLVWSAGAVRYLPHHLHRMRAAAVALHLPLPPALADTNALTAAVRRVAAANSLSEARVRIQLWRGGGGLYTPPVDAPTQYVATASPFQPNDQPVHQAGFARETHTFYTPLSFCKGPHALYYVRAGQERQTRGLDEVLLLDANGHVAEAVSAAVFWVKDGQLFTPTLATGCVAGVRRAHLLAVARRQDLPCQEGLFRPDQLLTAEAVFTANVAGLRPVEHLDGVALTSAAHPLLGALRRWEADEHYPPTT